MNQKYFPITHYEYVYTLDKLSIKRIIDNLSLKFKGESVTYDLIGNYLVNMNETDSYNIFKMLYKISGSLTFNMFYHIYKMRECGEKIYYIHKNICEMLLHTTLNVSSDLIQIPFREIYLCFDQDELTLSDDERVLPIKGAYINLEEIGGGIRRLRVLATSGINGIEGLKDINFFFKIDLIQGRVNDIVESYVEKLERGELPISDNADLNTKTIPALFRLIINTLLYITSKSPDILNMNPDRVNIDRVKSNKKKRKLENKIGKVAQLPFIKVGYNTPRIAYNNGESLQEGTKISYQFTVSGHWRMQWKGSKSNDTWKQEPVWIKPYIKGEDLAEGIHKKYIVE